MKVAMAQFLLYVVFYTCLILIFGQLIGAMLTALCIVVSIVLLLVRDGGNNDKQ